MIASAMERIEREVVSATTAPPAKTRLWGRRGRLGILGVVLAASFVTVGLVGRWAHYRYGHIVDGNATVRSLVTKIGARLDGVVASVEVGASQRVRQGDLLARLDDRLFRALVAQERFRLQAAIQALQVEKMGIEHERRRLAMDVARADADLEAAVAQVQAAESEHDRWEKEYAWIAALKSSGATSSKETADVVAALATANGLATAARARRQSAGIECRTANIEQEGLRVRESRLAVLESQVEVARSALVAAQADLDATFIRAPG